MKQVTANPFVDQQNGSTYYRVLVETNNAAILHDGKQLEILPGMIATVDIQTGAKTVWNYLLKPVNKVRLEAMRER